MFIRSPLKCRRAWGRWREYRFWQRWFRTRGWKWPADYHRRLDPETPFSPYLRRFLPGDRKICRVLDVGAGPLTEVGYRWEGRTLEIVAVDPLAELYRKLYAKYRVTPPVPTRPGRAEDLSLLFGADSFDLVQARNSLDHAEDPLAGIREMIYCVRPGGWVVLNHNPNEGAGEGYRGLHQWNFFLEKGRFFIGDRQGRRLDVDRELTGVEIEVNLKLANWVQVHIRKTGLDGSRG